MLHRNMMLKYMSPEGDGGGAGGSGDNDSEGDPQLTNEQLMAQIKDLTTSNAKMKGHMDDLLGEKKAEKERREAAEAEAQAKALEASKNAGDMAKFEEQINTQFAAKETGYQSQIDELNNVILGGKKSELITELSSKFRSPPAAKLMLGGMISTKYGDNKSVLTEFKGLDGQVVTTDLKAFVEYIQNSEALTPILNGVPSTGGSNNGIPVTVSGSSTSQVKSDKQSRIDSINKKFNIQ